MLTMRNATLDDARLLFDWRNDPVTREASHSTAEIDFASHCAWLAGSLQKPGRVIYIFEADGVPVGTVRADTDEVTTLSWTVAPEHRGKGYGKRMVAMIAGANICAEIKAGNIASQRIAEHIGMKLVKQVGDVLHYAG